MKFSIKDFFSKCDQIRQKSIRNFLSIHPISLYFAILIWHYRRQVYLFKPHKSCTTSFSRSLILILSVNIVPLKNLPPFSNKPNSSNPIYIPRKATIKA